MTGIFAQAKADIDLMTHTATLDNWEEVLNGIKAMGPDLAKVLELHAPRGSFPVIVCGYCNDLCHSSSGLNCEYGGDAVYPCDTVQLLAAAAETFAKAGPGR